MNRILTNVENEPIIEDQDGRIHFKSCARIDSDGSGGNVWHEKWFQPDTTLHKDGKALNANQVPYFVAHPSMVSGVKGVVMGSKGRVTNLKTGKKVDGVWADLGPRLRLGEMSVEAARRLGIPCSPITGGEDDHTILYECWPDVPAVVDGITYQLQRS